MIKIPVDEIRLGITIIKTDKPWLNLSFFNKPVTDLKIIDILKNYGVKEVYIQSDEIAEDFFGLNKQLKNEIVQQAEKLDITKYTTTLKEIDELKSLHERAKKITKQLYLDARAGKSIDTEMAQKIVDTFVDSCFKKPHLVVTLSRLKSFDDYTFVHSLNVGVLSIVLGKRYGLDVVGLKNLGMGALLHDIGKMKVPDKILNKPGKLTDEEFEIMKKHPVYGYEMLKNDKNIHEDSLSAIYLHHERADGSGYPLGLREAKIPLSAKIVSIVDVYDAITSKRVYHDALIPPKALQLLFSWSEKHFNKILVKFFMEIIGIYPVGTLVLLDTGELAIVFEQSKDDPTRPKVLVITDERRKMKEPYLFDLKKYNLITKKPYKSIIAPLDSRKLNIDTNKIMDKFLIKAKQGVLA
ncbi:metal dependent phosphohydrolase [Deferribacter desulfuricans SSM1]|uniref:Metal dependent phosphohydrolase n=1 Tax=Deferribacter desulfuricans (strain DSM 14783 / JCM 11476 / NBRC 101012 / SSM1) TaxID=639282 RepID=D3PA35_DEFDS|nr:HD-GYP domain-containing protein [Deferribacter desulfuricans]BAI81575.1 metal dependent phosphohydrolase [Deferribacter desulfuricans SSM1]